MEVKEEVQTPTKALSMYGKLESSLESSPIIKSSSNTTPSRSPRFSTELPIRFSPRLQEKRNSMFLLADGTQPHELPYGNSTNFASVDVESPLPKMQRSMKRKAMMDSDDSVNKSSPFTVEISDNEFDRSPRNPQQAKRRLFISDTYMPDDCSIQGDSSALGLSEEFVEHYDSDPLLPIYKPLSTGIKTKEAIQLLLRPLKPTQLARNIPLNIQRNVSFVFSIQNIGHWKNALCDGMGRWTQTGTETVLYNLDVDGEIRVISEIQSTEDSVRVYRRKYVNASYNKLHRIVIHLENPNTSEILDQMFVQYYFEGDETAVNVAPHGNSKKPKSIKGQMRLQNKESKTSVKQNDSQRIYFIQS